MAVFGGIRHFSSSFGRKAFYRPRISAREQESGVKKVSFSGHFHGMRFFWRGTRFIWPRNRFLGGDTYGSEKFAFFRFGVSVAAQIFTWRMQTLIFHKGFLESRTTLRA